MGIGRDITGRKKGHSGGNGQIIDLDYETKVFSFEKTTTAYYLTITLGYSSIEKTKISD